MKRYLTRILIFLSPFLFLFLVFVVFDPFGMIHKELPQFVMGESANDDFNTLNKFDTNNPEYKYNAFVFGNSKTLAILSTDWSKYIGKQRFFKFGSPGESLLNIRKKLEYAISKGNKIDYAIILLDGKVLSNTDNESPMFSGPVYLKGPKSSYNNELQYVSKGFYYFLYDAYFLNFFKKAFTKSKQNSSVKEPDWDIINQTMTKDEYLFLQGNNEFYRWDTEKAILKDSLSWVEGFNPATIEESYTKVVLDRRDIEHLKQIKNLFDKQKTNFKIVFGPEYQCTKMGADILTEFNKIFASENVYDFTQDSEYCDNPILYYEPNHYRPVVGSYMLEEIYKTK